MTQDEMNTLIGQVLEQDDRAERSTLLDQLRGEVGSLFESNETLMTENTDLKAKNERLVEANSSLFMKVGFDAEKEKEKEKKKKSEDFNIKKMF